MRKTLTYLTPALVGAAAAAVVSMAVAPSQSSLPPSPTLVAGTDEFGGRYRAFNLSAEPLLPSGDADSGGPAHSDTPTSETQEEADNETDSARLASTAAEISQRHAEMVTTIRDQPVDPRWGHAARWRMQESLLEIADDLELNVLALDCYSDACVATVEWMTFADAVRLYRGAATASNPLNCATLVHVDDPGPAHVGPVQAEIIYEDCLAAP